MCALRSPAMRPRACAESVPRKLSLRPRTPTRAATPTATESTTKANLPGADLRSRQAMAEARDQLRARLAIFFLALDEGGGEDRKGVLDDEAVFENDLTVGA